MKKRILRCGCALFMLCLCLKCEEPVYAQEIYVWVTPIPFVQISSPPIIEVCEIECSCINYSEEDLDILARLVMAEAGNQELEGIRLVVDVVLNRIDSERFPNTIREVAYQNGQFSVINNGTFDRAIPNEKVYEAIRLESISRLNYNILFFARGQNGRNCFKVGDHWFGE